jgi:hypothetical protein
MEEKMFLDVQNLADYIHLSKSCVYKMVSNKSIPQWNDKYLVYNNDYDLFQVPAVLARVIKL